MKKQMRSSGLPYIAVLACCLWTTSAFAVDRPPPASPYDGGVPAAPEPYPIAMLAGGLGLVGGYVVYRIRKNKAQQ
jgi:hypothetical protein